MFFAIAVATNAMAAINSPRHIVAGAAVYVCPFICSLFLVVHHRTLSELALAYCSLAASVLWLVAAWALFEQGAV